MQNTLKAQVLVVGGGLAGNLTALAFAQSAMSVILVKPNSTSHDPRTTALLHDSVEYLKTLGLWEGISEFAHPLKIMRLVDASTRLVRSPQIDFNSEEIGIEAFGHNVRNQDVLDLFSKTIEHNDLITLVDGHAVSYEQDENEILANVKTGNNKTQRISADYLVGADGRNSLVREAFLRDVREWSYPQAALVVDFEHDVNSRFTSTEFHTEMGPFTVVPQTSHRAGLVWMEKPETVAQLLELDVDALSLRLEQQMGSYLGKVKVDGKAASFPLKAMTARKFGHKRVFLVGEAGHVFPPIGAQGFNLGVRDVETLVETITQGHQTGDLGEAYSRKRIADVQSRTFGVDLLNRSLLSSFFPLQLARTAGMHALKNSVHLRKAMMKLGISSRMFASQ